jgi:hypothetical protein
MAHLGRGGRDERGGEASMNFKGVQTLRGESGKFTKILTQHHLHKSEFCWAHLYAKIEVLTQVSK